jgi:hypothetical protein
MAVGADSGIDHGVMHESQKRRSSMLPLFSTPALTVAATYTQFVSRSRRWRAPVRSLTQHLLAVEHPGLDITACHSAQSAEYNAVSKSRYTWYTSGATNGRVWL